MRELMLPILQRALVGAEALSAVERADVYDGIAALCRPHDCLARERAAAESTAVMIREAEGHQLTFANLLSQA